MPSYEDIKHLTICSARIVSENRGSIVALPNVYVRFAPDGEEHRLFDYYPDELHFAADEFIGLTPEQAHELKFQRDKAYLQS